MAGHRIDTFSRTNVVPWPRRLLVSPTTTATLRKARFPTNPPRALELEEIPRIVEDYRQAALRAKAAGFDGLEIHAANGYLLDQFLQAKTNQRDDRYGGRIANRYRLLGEVVEAATAAFPVERISVRLSPNGVFNDMGTPEYGELFPYVIAKLENAGIGFLHIMDGLGFGFHELGEPVTLAQVRPIFSGVLIGNVGCTRESAEHRIGRGQADMIAFGRPFISNPDLVERFKNDWPLTPEADMATWYSHDESGYSDWLVYPSASKASQSISA